MPPNHMAGIITTHWRGHTAIEEGVPRYIFTQSRIKDNNHLHKKSNTGNTLHSIGNKVL